MLHDRAKMHVKYAEFFTAKRQSGDPKIAFDLDHE